MTMTTLQNNKILSLTAMVLDMQGDPINGSSVTWEVYPQHTIIDITPTETGCVVTPRHGEIGVVTIIATHVTPGAPLIEEVQINVVAPVAVSIQITAQID